MYRLFSVMCWLAGLSLALRAAGRGGPAELAGGLDCDKSGKRRQSRR